MRGPNTPNPNGLWFDDSLLIRDTIEFSFLPKVLDSGSAIYRLNQGIRRYFSMMEPENRIRRLMQPCWISMWEPGTCSSVPMPSSVCGRNISISADSEMILYLISPAEIRPGSGIGPGDSGPEFMKTGSNGSGLPKTTSVTAISGTT